MSKIINSHQQLKVKLNFCDWPAQIKIYSLHFREISGNNQLSVYCEFCSKIVLTFTRWNWGASKIHMKPKLALAFLSSHRAEVALPHVSFALKKNRHLLLSYSRVLRNRGDQPIHILKAWTHFPWDQCMVCLCTFIYQKKNYIYIYIHLQIYGIFTYIIVNTYMQNTMDPRSLQKGQPPPKIGDERTSDSAMKKNYTSDWAWAGWFQYGSAHQKIQVLVHWTPLKFNIAPKNRQSQKETHLPTIIFQGLC